MCTTWTIRTRRRGSCGTPDRDTIMGHEFIGEVVGHGPDCSGDFPVGTRVTSMPIMIRARPGAAGHRPQPRRARRVRRADGGVGGDVADRCPTASRTTRSPLVDAFAVGEFYVRCSGIEPGELPLVIGAGAIGLSTVAALAARGVSPIVVSDYSDDRLAYAKKFGADVLVNPANARPVRRLAGDVPEQRVSDDPGHLRMRRQERPAAEHRRLVRVHGARVCRGRLVRRGHDRLHRLPRTRA